MLVPVHAERLAFPWIAAVVRHEPLARDEIQPAVRIHVHECRRVALRPGIVDHAARPTAIRTLFEPEHAVVVRRRGEDVVPAVAVHVEDVHEAELEHARRGARRR